MMDIRLRKAKKEDCPRLLELVQELATYERAPEEVTVTLEHFVESGFGNSPVWWAWVAENESEIVGFALYYIRYSTWKGQRMYLEDILVTNECRGKGIGSLLFNKLIEVSKEKNLKAICWQVLDWNEPAINFYKKYKGVKFSDEWVNCTLEIG
jgi:GNAT superfamily N-acetyltransferase